MEEIKIKSIKPESYEGAVCGYVSLSNSIAITFGQYHQFKTLEDAVNAAVKLIIFFNNQTI